MLFHKQVKVYNPFLKKKIEVDEKMKDILEYLWSKGYPTDYSCQGGFMDQKHGYGRCYISFTYKDLPIRFRSDIKKFIEKSQRYNSLTIEFTTHFKINRLIIRFIPFKDGDIDLFFETIKDLFK